MSNIGKIRILIPANVNIKIDGWKLYACGKYGSRHLTFPPHTILVVEDNYLRLVAPHIDRAYYGSLQRKLKALIHGLSLEYLTILEFVGVGYKPRIEKTIVILRLGFSHEISVTIPENLNVIYHKRNNLKISGSNYEKVRNFAYKLRSFRRPEPFKGKGIVILGEDVRRKEGKKKKI